MRPATGSNVRVRSRQQQRHQSDDASSLSKKTVKDHNNEPASADSVTATRPDTSAPPSALSASVTSPPASVMRPATVPKGVEWSQSETASSRSSLTRNTGMTNTTIKKRISFSELVRDQDEEVDLSERCQSMMGAAGGEKRLIDEGGQMLKDAGEQSGAEPAGTDGPVSAYPVRQRTTQAKRRNSLFVKRGSICMEPIKTVVLDDVYSVYKQLGTGRFGYIKLAEHKESATKIAIKFFPRPKTKQVDFIREYNYSYFLSPHQNIIDTYEGMFQTKDDSAFFFVQEFCPCASLREQVEGSNGQGIGEVATKAIMLKVLSALEFMHNENLVHRNLKAENILIFDNDFNKVKVTDFGLTRKTDTTVKYLEYVNSYHAPELCETLVNESWTVNKSIDIWALGVLFYYSSKGRFPWQKATIMCKPYWEWEQWLKRKNPQLPKRWDLFTEKALKLFKRTLNPKYKDRYTVKEVRKLVAKERLLKPAKVIANHSRRSKSPQSTKRVTGPTGLHARSAECLSQQQQDEDQELTHNRTAPRLADLAFALPWA